MSALAGIWRFDGRPDVDADCARMLAAQRMYGPHDRGQWCNGALAIGRRLFRTLPEDLYDRQPLQSRDGRLTLVADVRLDNREDLIGEFGLTAAEGQLLCDAAILLEALDRWGDAAINRLIGDFAFALWDAKAQRLLLARDFKGQRPLHYHHGHGFFAFASMPKGLHALAEIPYGPDEHLVAEFLVLMPRRGPRSFFRDVARVEPAHQVTVTRHGVSARRYWQPQRPGGKRLRSSDYVEGLRHHLDQATRSRLRGVNGAVATQLTAGLDSSAVSATAARLLAASGGKVVAFTAVPREGYNGPYPRNSLGDEGPLAGATAAMYSNIEHVLIRSGHRSPLEGLDRGFYLFERPVLNLCNAGWLAAINQGARDRQLGVLLIGAMGNASASYDGIELLPELLLKGRLIRLWREIRDLRRKRGMRGRIALIETFGSFMPNRLWRCLNKKYQFGQSTNVSEYSAIHPSYFADLNLEQLARERDLDFSYRPWRDGFAARLWVTSREDNGDINKGTLAGWGIDSRDPMADRRLFEFCLSVPTDEYLFHGVRRALAKRAFTDRLPPTVLNRRKRGYPGADWHEGLTAARGEVAAELERLAACALAAKALHIGRMQNLVGDWPPSGWERDDVEYPYRLALLRGISAGHFLRKASGANR